MQPKMVAATSEAVEAVARTILARWSAPGPTVNEVNQGPGVGKGTKGNSPELDQVRQDEGDRDRG